MPYRTDIAYRYDGSFEGMLSCVFESFEKKELPPDIFTDAQGQTTFFETRRVRSDPERAQRVLRGIAAKIAPEAAQLVYRAHLTCLLGKEAYILRFLHKGFAKGPGVLHMLTDEDLYPLNAAVGHLMREQHLLSGFIRFSEIDGVLVAAIDPKNRVLPLLSGHFQSRLASERFLIYDRTHEEALVGQPGEARILPLAGFEPPPAGADERQVRALWRAFYRSVAIRERENPRLRRSHMPMRYWGNMTEFGADEPVAGAELPAPRGP